MMNGLLSSYALQDKSHTIVLVQKTPSRASRTFLDYETISGAVDGEWSSVPKRQICVRMAAGMQVLQCRILVTVLQLIIAVMALHECRHLQYV